MKKLQSKLSGEAFQKSCMIFSNTQSTLYSFFRLIFPLVFLTFNINSLWDDLLYSCSREKVLKLRLLLIYLPIYRPHWPRLTQQRQSITLMTPSMILSMLLQTQRLDLRNICLTLSLPHCETNSIKDPHSHCSS
mgnify:CR=1 FL=1